MTRHTYIAEGSGPSEMADPVAILVAGVVAELVIAVHADRIALAAVISARAQDSIAKRQRGRRPPRHCLSNGGRRW